MGNAGFMSSTIWAHVINLDRTHVKILQVASTLLTLAVPECWLKGPLRRLEGVQGLWGREVGLLIVGVVFLV